MKISVNFEVKQTNKDHEEFLRAQRANIFAYDSEDNFDLCVNQLVNADLNSLNKVDDTYIIECYVNKVDLHAFIKSVEFLNDGLLQDCTAIYFHDLKEGLLVGRLAEKWGEFNIDYFKFN